MTIKKIGTIDLDNPVWWTNYNNTPKIQSAVESTINGGVIVWEQSYQTNSENVTLSSKDSGWQSIDTKDLIKALVVGSLGTTTTITDTDDNVINVRFRHEVDGGAVKFERVVDSKLSKYYTIELFLAKV